MLRKIETPAIFRFVDSILAGRAIELYNFGHLRRDFTFVEDILEGAVRVLAFPPGGGSAQGRGSQAPMRLCNIGNQQPVELLHVVHTIERCLGRSVRIRLMPMQQGDVYETHACVDKLREVTGYCPRVSIDEGKQRFVDWYLNEYLPLGLAEPPLFLLPPPWAYSVHIKRSPRLFSVAGLSRKMWGCRNEEARMTIQRRSASAPADGAECESDGNSTRLIFRATHTGPPDYKESNGLSIRWLCRRGPVPSVYNWDPWLED